MTEPFDLPIAFCSSYSTIEAFFLDFIALRSNQFAFNIEIILVGVLFSKREKINPHAHSIGHWHSVAAVVSKP